MKVSTCMQHITTSILWRTRITVRDVQTGVAYIHADEADHCRHCACHPGRHHSHRSHHVSGGQVVCTSRGCWLSYTVQVFHIQEFFLSRNRDLLYILLKSLHSFLWSTNKLCNKASINCSLQYFRAGAASLAVRRRVRTLC